MSTKDTENTSKALDEILGVLNKHNLKAKDLVLLYGNLGYSLGASVDGYEGGEGPTYEELEQKYYTKPTVGTALMLQGMLVTTWYDEVEQDDE